MMPDQHNSDHDAQMLPAERVAKLETKVAYVKETVMGLTNKLQSHIDDVSTSLTSMYAAIEKLAVTAQHHSSTMDRMAETLESIASQNTRLHLLEATSGRVDSSISEISHKIESLDDRTQANTEKWDRLSWAAGIGSTLVAAAWALWQYISKSS
jgi:uncharacterized coiled-coil protein SlyX